MPELSETQRLTAQIIDLQAKINVLIDALEANTTALEANTAARKLGP